MHLSRSQNDRGSGFPGEVTIFNKGAAEFPI